MDTSLGDPGKSVVQASASIDYTVIDDFLEPSQCRALHKSMLCNQMWRKKNPISKHLYNSRPKAAIIGNVLEKVNSVMRERAGHALQLIDYWALLYAKNSDGNTHADFGQLTLTYWLTPEKYNLDATTGGLLIYDVKRRMDQSADEYLIAGQASEEYVLQRTQHHVNIPYRCNRAVLFDASHYHKTFAPHFNIAQPEGMRMNLTFSYACAEHIAEQVRLING